MKKNTTKKSAKVSYLCPPSAAQDCEAELRKWLSNSSLEYAKEAYYRNIKEDAEIERIADTCNGMFAGNVSCEKYIRAGY